MVDMDDLADLIADTLAVHRLTRLITADDLTATPRDAVVRWAYRRSHREADAADMMRRSGLTPEIPGSWGQYAATVDPAPPSAATLITCRWCSSVWLAVGVLILRRLAPRLWRMTASTLAVSSVSTLLAGLEK